MLLVKSACEGNTHDSHFLPRAILDYPHKNVRHFKGTQDLVAHEHEVAFELYHIFLSLVNYFMYLFAVSINLMS